MNEKERTTILASDEPAVYFGREDELADLLSHARGESEHPAMLVLAAPAQGLSELMRQTYDRLFTGDEEIIPVYFGFKKSDRTQKETAVRFLQEFLRQTAAFRRGDPDILDVSPDVCEISELTAPADAGWAGQLIEACTRESELNNESAFIRQALSAPLRANAAGARTCVMFDDLESLEHLTGATDLLEELKAVYVRSRSPFVFAGKRRYVLDAMRTGTTRLPDTGVLHLAAPSFETAGEMTGELCERQGVALTDQARDLLVRLCGASPVFIRYLVEAAAERGDGLDTYRRVAKVCMEELFGGRLLGYYDSVFDRIVPDRDVQKRFVSLVYNALTAEKERVPVGSWRTHTGLDPEAFDRAMRLFDAHEVIDVSSNMVAAGSENEVLKGYLTKRFRLELRGDRRGLALAEMLAGFLKRAPRMMAGFYRRQNVVGLRELLEVFDRQEVPISLLYYNVFKDLHKGKEESEILSDIARDPEKVSLPQIVYATHTVAVYPQIGSLGEKERSAVALGFEAADYTDEKEVVWIAAEIDSKLEAAADLTAFWCDRLEMVALMCDFRRYRLWLIAPEGFSPEAVKVLNGRNAVGSSRRQVELLARHLDAGHLVGTRSVPNEFEMVIPMGDDTEMIAAHAVEEIARRHSFDARSINQIKTALVEACINATEHSNSPDRKIYQKFNVEDGKMTITVSNRGLRFRGAGGSEVTSEEGRRGWGLKLMRSLMDEVRFEEVDEGARISLVKYRTEARDEVSGAAPSGVARQ